MLRRDFLTLPGAALLAAATVPQPSTGTTPSDTGLADPLLRHVTARHAQAPESRTPAELRASVSRAKGAYQACRYAAVARGIPRALAACETARDALTGGERLTAHTCLAELATRVGAGS